MALRSWSVYLRLWLRTARRAAAAPALRRPRPRCGPRAFSSAAGSWAPRLEPARVLGLPGPWWDACWWSGRAGPEASSGELLCDRRVPRASRCVAQKKPAASQPLCRLRRCFLLAPRKPASLCLDTDPGFPIPRVPSKMAGSTSTRPPTTPNPISGKPRASFPPPARFSCLLAAGTHAHSWPRDCPQPGMDA